jgi:hypothetical protein
MPEMLTVAACCTWFEANLVKSKLEAFDFHPTLVDAQTVNTNWLWSNALGGIKVQVPAFEVEQARQVLESEPAEPPGEPGSSETAAVACPVCGGSNTHDYLDKRGSFLSWLILSIPVIPALTRRICRDCGSKWKV